MSKHPTSNIATSLFVVVSISLPVGLTVMLAVLGMPLWIFLVAGLLALFVSLNLLGRWGTRQVQNRIGSRAATQKEFPQLHNAIDGLCLSHGIEAPDLSVLDSSAINIAVTSNGSKNILTVTTGTLKNLGAVELEAMLAQALVRTQEPSIGQETRKSFWVSLPIFRYFLRNTVETEEVLLLDQKSVALTRFPPGLMNAIEISDQIGTFIEGATSTSHLWLLDPTAQLATSGHPSASLRCAALSEL
ncbi:MAG: Protease HtpX [Acidimicrobiales bacterium AG-410-I20]|nr:MAG: Protease HtpX [Acidimicrobiales bacterium AG-410-I20]